jgi:hypothetical protein
VDGCKPLARGTKSPAAAEAAAEVVMIAVDTAKTAWAAGQEEARGAWVGGRGKGRATFCRHHRSSRKPGAPSKVSAMAAAMLSTIEVVVAVDTGLTVAASPPGWGVPRHTTAPSASSLSATTAAAAAGAGARAGTAEETLAASAISIIARVPATARSPRVAAATAAAAASVPTTGVMAEAVAEGAGEGAAWGAPLR